MTARDKLKESALKAAKDTLRPVGTTLKVLELMGDKQAGDILIDALMEELRAMRPGGAQEKKPMERCTYSAPQGTVGLDFGDAIKAVKRGHRIGRKGWNGKGMYVVCREGYPDGIPCDKKTADAVGIPEGSLIKIQPYLQMKCADGSFQMWLASQSDIMAEDWWIVEPAREEAE